jgi:hybrid cluster-associated redox disulfide protein
MINAIAAGQNVAELLALWPQVIPVFLTHHMSCVGCSMSRFETLDDVSKIYSLNLDAFLTEINQSLQQGT